MKNYSKLACKTLKIIVENKKEGDFKIRAEIRRNLKLTDEEISDILRDLKNKNFIDGVVFHKHGYSFYNPRITCEGHEFMKKNSFLKKLYNIIKEIKEWLFLILIMLSR